MTSRLDDRIRDMMQQVVDESPAPPPTPLGPSVHPESRRSWTGWTLALSTAAAILLIIVGAAWLFSSTGSDEPVGPVDTQIPPTTVRETDAEERLLEAEVDEVVVDDALWTVANLDGYLTSLALVGDEFLATRLLGDGQPEVLVSSDGIAWKAADLGPVGAGSEVRLVEGGRFGALAEITRTELVDVGDDDGPIPYPFLHGLAFTRDGESFAVTDPLASAGLGDGFRLAAAAVGDSGVLALLDRSAGSGALLYSQDGQSWSVVDSPAPFPVKGVVGSGAGYLIFTDSGVDGLDTGVWFLSNELAWERVEFPTDHNLELEGAASWSRGFVVAGAEWDVETDRYTPHVWVSNDGLEWRRDPWSFLDEFLSLPGTYNRVVVDGAGEAGVLLRTFYDSDFSDEEPGSFFSVDGETWNEWSMPAPRGATGMIFPEIHTVVGPDRVLTTYPLDIDGRSTTDIWIRVP